MSKQKSDQTPDDVEIPVENKEFMDEFFVQVMWINYTVFKWICTFECHTLLKIKVPKRGVNSNAHEEPFWGSLKSLLVNSS